jgi:3-methyladenine DNA glycosylase Mpg
MKVIVSPYSLVLKPFFPNHLIQRAKKRDRVAQRKRRDRRVGEEKEGCCLWCRMFRVVRRRRMRIWKKAKSSWIGQGREEDPIQHGFRVGIGRVRIRGGW